MTSGEDTATGAAGFAERLLEVIDSGRRTATYKLALLMALLDLCARRSDASGRAPRLLHTRDIAEQVAALYWPQVIPYRLPGAGVAVELRQINLPRAAIVGAVSSFRERAESVGATSLFAARQWLRGDYESMVDQVEITVSAQPLPRLQAVGTAEAVFPFIYELDWGTRESFSTARLRRHGPRGPAIRLLPGAGDELVRLGPLVRPLVELHWTRMVAEINHVAQAELDLHRHLFGSDRLVPPQALRDGIADLQGSRCFYCRGTLGAQPEADHFIPRVRCGIDAVENLVLADRRCNNDKRDLLPGAPHVEAWAQRNRLHATALTGLATASRWDTDPESTGAVARSIYSHLPAGGTPLWLGYKNVATGLIPAPLCPRSADRMGPGWVAAIAGPRSMRPCARSAPTCGSPPPRCPNFGTYLAQRAAGSRLRPVPAGHAAGPAVVQRRTARTTAEYGVPGQQQDAHVTGGLGYHARSPRRCSSVGRAAVL